MASRSTTNQHRWPMRKACRGCSQRLNIGQCRLSHNSTALQYAKAMTAVLHCSRHSMWAGHTHWHSMWAGRTHWHSMWAGHTHLLSFSNIGLLLSAHGSSTTADCSCSFRDVVRCLINGCSHSRPYQLQLRAAASMRRVMVRHALLHWELPDGLCLSR
jgi:hypothetical protein